MIPVVRLSDPMANSFELIGVDGKRLKGDRAEGIDRQILCSLPAFSRSVGETKVPRWLNGAGSEAGASVAMTYGDSAIRKDCSQTIRSLIGLLMRGWLWNP